MDIISKWIGKEGQYEMKWIKNIWLWLQYNLLEVINDVGDLTYLYYFITISVTAKSSQKNDYYDLPSSLYE